MSFEYPDYLDGKHQIRQDVLEDLLVEVTTGRRLFSFRNDLFGTRFPTPDETDRGRIIYTKRLHQLIGRGILTREKMDQVALNNGLIDAKARTEREQLLKMIERQVKGRDMTQDLRHRAQLDKEINVARIRAIELESSENHIFRNCAEVLADERRTAYLVCCCTLTGEMIDQPIWKSWDEYKGCKDWELMNVARDAFQRSQIGIPNKVIRALSRTYEWRMRWKASTESGTPPFADSSSAWDKNKRVLIYWSNFYDNIFQHPECPDDETINDDESLQTWLNYQVAQRKKNKTVVAGRRSPTYKAANGRSVPMTKIGADKSIKVNQPYRVRA